MQAISNSGTLGSNCDHFCWRTTQSKKWSRLFTEECNPYPPEIIKVDLPGHSDLVFPQSFYVDEEYKKDDPSKLISAIECTGLQNDIQYMQLVLSQASQHLNPEMIKYAISHGALAEPTGNQPYGDTPIRLALARLSSPIALIQSHDRIYRTVSTLMENGADPTRPVPVDGVNGRAHVYHVALHDYLLFAGEAYPSWNGYIEILQLMLDHGLDTNFPLPQSDGTSELLLTDVIGFYAVQNYPEKYAEVLQTLADYGALPDPGVEAYLYAYGNSNTDRWLSSFLAKNNFITESVRPVP
ncbi:hypothetical protein [Zobellella sp. An-6]|uniref:hypothetical protein n=1 Tax=Zobellella sp. An-6 TaxID=3400218 RepID=UPI0040414380